MGFRPIPAYSWFMGNIGNEAVGILEVILTLLRNQERRAREVILSPLSSPEIRAKALEEHAALITMIRRRTAELKRLETEL